MCIRDSFSAYPLFKDEIEAGKVDWNKDKVIERIKNYVKNYDTYIPAIRKQTKKLSEEFFSANGILENIKEGEQHD